MAPGFDPRWPYSLVVECKLTEQSLMIVWLVAFHFPTSIVKEKLNPAVTLTNLQGSYLSGVLRISHFG